MQKDSKYGVAVRLSNPESESTQLGGKNFDKMEHFVTLPRNGKNRPKDQVKNGMSTTPRNVKARSGAASGYNQRGVGGDLKSRSQSLPRNQTIEQMNHDLSRDDSDRSYDPLERQIFQMAKQASKEADRMRNVSENSRTAREVTRRGGGNGTLGRNRPRSVGALRRGNVHTSGSEGTRFSSGPDGDSEYTRSDTEKMGRQRPTNPVEYVSVTSMKNDGSMTSQLLKMDDSKSGETRIDELTSGKEIKRQLIRAMKELRDLGMVARVIDEIDDENWLMMFVQELEVHVKQIIQMEKKIKQLIHQAREGRADGYKELIKGLTVQLKSKKSTLLDCLNDILRYFQDRLRSKDIRTFKSKYIHGVVKQVMTDTEAVDSEFSTLSRKLKKLSAQRPDLMQGRPNKWQMELQRVSRTVDEYLRMAMPSELRSNSGSDVNPTDSTSTLGRSSHNKQNRHQRQVSGFSTDCSNYGSNTLDRRRGRPQRSNHWDGNRTRSLERGKKGEMEQQMRNADSGLDLDDSGSANESYFHQSEPERRTTSGSTSQSGRPRERASIRLYVATSSDDDGGARQRQRQRDQPSELQRKAEDTRRMKSQLEKLQREIVESNTAKKEKERRLAEAQRRLEQMQRVMTAGIQEKADLEAELIRMRDQMRSGRSTTSRNAMVLQSRITEMGSRIQEDKREMEASNEKIATLQAELAGNRRTAERLERAKHDLEDQLNQLTVQLMSERKELRNLQLENVRLETELNEASQRLEEQQIENQRNESQLQSEMSKLIDNLRDEKKRNSTLKRSGGKNNRELQDLKFTVNDQKSKLQELTSEHVELQHQNRKLQEMLKGEQQVNNSTMDCIKKELEYTTQELSIQRDQANQQKAEFEKEIEKLLFDNREIKEHSRKTQRELSKEISSLTSELKDERDRIHELQKENRKLRQENIELQTKLTKLENSRGRIRPENVTDTSVQVDDTTFTRKKAFDFYIDEVKRDAHKLLERGREMERNVTNVAREAQNRVEHDIHDARTNPMPPSQPPSQLPMHQTQNSGHSSKSSKSSKKGSKSSSSTSTETDNPSATSKFSRRWSFKKLSMMNKKG